MTRVMLPSMADRSTQVLGEIISNITLDAGLIDAVAGGRAVLFLGAGASIGAMKSDGTKIPDAKELGRRIANEFLGPGYEEADFKTICDYAASARSVRELQAFIHKQLAGYSPARFHLSVPTFVWAGIVTTNYDQVLEEAYRTAPSRVQDLTPNCRDGDGAAERLGNRGLLYVKLHGCISHYQEVDPPLVASTEQIINHKQGRAGQFAQFLEWAQTKTIIFVGYGLGDFNLRTLFEEIRRDGDNHPRHFIVRPGIKSAEENYWIERRVKTVSTNFETLLSSLDSAVRQPGRELAVLASTFAATSFSRFIVRSNVAESPALIRYLESACEHVSDQTAVGIGTPAKFYRGFDLGWYPAAHNLDVPRRIAQVLSDERILPTKTISKPQFAVLKGHAGSGKTVILRRLAWDAAQVFERLVFWIGNASGLAREHFEEIVGLTNQTIYLFIDDLAEDADRLADFYRFAQRQKWPIVIIGGVRVNEWNMRGEALEPLIDEEYELKYLSEREIDNLLGRLEEYGCLGHLSQLSRERQRLKFKEVYGRQLLVALHEATENASFREIISDEYAKIFPPEAKILYLDICSLHRFGTPVRAGLISRVHGIDFDDFSQRFFKPLEHIIDLKRDSKTRDWVYCARHSVIADIVYSVALPSVKEKYDNLLRILSKLNPSYSYDREVLSQLIKASTLADIFRDRVLGNTIYEAATTAFGEDGFILHQRGIYEMRLAGDAGALDRAERYLEAALESSGENLTIRHSLAELAFKRSVVAQDEEEREAWRRRSEIQALALVRVGRNSYPTHTLAKIAIARVRDALSRSEADPSDLAQEALSESIKAAEDVLRNGLQRFPNDDRLLTEEATLSEILQNADRALKALERAFKANPRSELIARRLARILRAKSRSIEAIDVLRQALELNAGSQVLHYDLAQSLRESHPDADIKQADTILYHLERSFSPGDKNHEARFWYARQLCLCHRASEARPLFSSLKQLPIPFRQKRGIRGIVLDADGERVRFYGQVTFRGTRFGFVRADHDGLEAFVPADNVMDNLDFPHLGSRVVYSLGFNLAGPVALDLREE